MKKILLVAGVSMMFGFLILQIVAPVVVMGTWAEMSVEDLGDPAPVSQDLSGQTPSSQGLSGQASGTLGIKNPLKVDSIQGLIREVVKFAVNLLAIAGALYIMWSGFLLVKAQGNPKELETAKKSFFNAIIGMAIILGAWAIATVISNTINKITNNNNVVLEPIK